MVHIYHITFQWYNKVNLKTLLTLLYFIFYQHVKTLSQLNLSLGYIFSIFLKFHQSQPRYSYKKILTKKSVLKKNVIEVPDFVCYCLPFERAEFTVNVLV